MTRIRAALLDGLAADPDRRSPQDDAKELLADLLDWHRREAKPAWWRYFHVRALTDAELVDEPDAIGRLSGGQVTEHVKKSVVVPVLFPTAGARILSG